MKRILLSGAAGTAIAFALALPVAAQGVTVDGYAELEYVFDGDFDDTFLNADISLSVGPGFMGGVPIGFDAALVLSHDGDDSIDALYGALTYTTGFGKFSIGVPRPVLADMIEFPAIGGIRTLDLSYGQLTGSAAESAYLQDFDTPVGLRYDGSFGALAVGASWHRFDDGAGEADITGLVLRYDLGAFAAYAGGEWLNATGGNAEDFVIGVEGEMDLGTARLRGGLAWFDREILFGGIDGFRVFATYMPTDQIDVSAGGIFVDGEQVLGLDLKYRFYQGAYAGFGVANEDSSIYNVSLGWEF